MSWDDSGVTLWSRDHSDKKNIPYLLHQLKFPKNEQGYITTLAYIPKLKVFVAAALDMSFKIYDRTLALVESIRHEERAILALEHDLLTDQLIVAGASGVSVWRVFRSISLSQEHVMEKLFVFDGCREWVSKVVLEPKTSRVYALVGRTAYVLSLKRRAVIACLENVHEASLTKICWYARSAFYLTACR